MVAATKEALCMGKGRAVMFDEHTRGVKVGVMLGKCTDIFDKVPSIFD